MHNVDASLPSADLLKLQADWLADARARLLRNAEIGKRSRVLDLGCGYGLIIPELKRRSSGQVIGLDRSLFALSSFVADVPVICADAAKLPFHTHTYDLVFSQNVLMWSGRITDVIREVLRVLQRNGSWVLFEPDYGGMMEYPSELQTVDLWVRALHRAGADPYIGRKLPAMLSAAGFMVRVELIPRLFFPHAARFDFLQELPLLPDEREQLSHIKDLAHEILPSQQVAHLPYFLIIADRS